MASLGKLDWSLVQAFLAVAESGSLSGAAKQLALTQPTVGRHIQTLEKDLGVSLFKRQARGMALTTQGEALLGFARRMHEAAAALSLNATAKAKDLSGTVRITASVMTSHHFLPPIVAELRETLPEVQIELVPNDASDNLLFGEADIAIRMYRPTQLDMVAFLVGEVHLGMYATPSYIQRHGRPTGPEDILSHQLVGFDRSTMMIDGFAEFGYQIDREFFPVRCDNQPVVWQLVRAGNGIGFAPLGVGSADPLVERIHVDFPLPRLPVWLTAHEAVRRSPRVDAVWNLLADRLRSACDA